MAVTVILRSSTLIGSEIGARKNAPKVPCKDPLCGGTGWSASQAAFSKTNLAVAVGTGAVSRWNLPTRFKQIKSDKQPQASQQTMGLR